MRVNVGDKLFVENLIELGKADQPITTTTLGELNLQSPGKFLVTLEMPGLPLIGEFAVTEIRLVPLENPASPLPKFEMGNESAETNTTKAN